MKNLLRPGIRLLLPCPNPKLGVSWGDYYFARSLAEVLERSGHRISYCFRPKKHSSDGRSRFWDRLKWGNSVDLVIRGSLPYRPIGKRPLFIWLISRTDTLTEEELYEARHVFVASEPYLKKLQSKGVSASFLPQCTDPRVFFPGVAEPGYRSRVLFVGNRRRYAPRPAVGKALAAGAELSVWGRGWEGTLSNSVWKGSTIDNAILGAHYRSADVVLNDHTSDMLSEGFVSNRVYDVLACGRPLLSEEMAGIPEDLKEHLYLYNDNTFVEVLEQALEGCALDRSGVAEHVRKVHSFECRAQLILRNIYMS